MVRLLKSFFSFDIIIIIIITIIINVVVVIFIIIIVQLSTAPVMAGNLD